MADSAGTRRGRKPARDRGETRMISIRFPIDLLLALREFARRNESSVTGELVRAVRAHLLRQQ